MNIPQATLAQSQTAAQAYAALCDVQQSFADNLLKAHPENLKKDAAFGRVFWLRDEGQHGGGHRLAYERGELFNTASVNISQVHYDDQPDKRLAAATALSTIIHPQHPHSPSIHLHVSWTEMREQPGYWRLMVDLNPAIPDATDRARIDAALKDFFNGQPDLLKTGMEQGDKYFYIPALDRHRGVIHFYLEQYRTEDFASGLQLASSFAAKMTEVYSQIIGEKSADSSPANSADQEAQRAYHTLYFLQVLTLDRGTTSGLLVHNQNDVGILGSIPTHIDKELLKSWQSKNPSPQDKLVERLVACIPEDGRVGESQKIALCQTIREHYKENPEALEMQARGDVLPPTVANHR